ncbi:hypothetical protein PRIEUP_LOCUS11964 [Pristimantis euphronides]
MRWAIRTTEDGTKTLNDGAQSEGDIVYWAQVWFALHKIERLDVAVELIKTFIQHKNFGTEEECGGTAQNFTEGKITSDY